MIIHNDKTHKRREGEEGRENGSIMPFSLFLK